MNKWTKWYINKNQSEPYADTISYSMGAEFLKDCDIVEDWGCGLGWFKKTYCGRAIGVDGTESKFSDVVADLATYKSYNFPNGIFMRHVLEHNENWKEILENALDTARYKFFLAIFTPFSETEKILGWTEELGVPDISLVRKDVENTIVAHDFGFEGVGIKSDTFFGVEYIYKCTK